MLLFLCRAVWYLVVIISKEPAVPIFRAEYRDKCFPQKMVNQLPEH